MFTGYCKDLSGQVFELSHRGNLARYNKTKEQIIQHANVTDGITVAKSIQLEEDCFHIFEKRPVAPPTAWLCEENEEYKHRFRAYIRKEEKHTGNLQKLYSVVIGQSCPDLEITMKGDNNFEFIDATCNTIQLLQLIQKTIFNKNKKSYIGAVICKSIRTYMDCIQTNQMSNTNYFCNIDAALKGMEALGVKFTFKPLVEMAASTLYWGWNCISYWSSKSKNATNQQRKFSMHI